MFANRAELSEHARNSDNVVPSLRLVITTEKATTENAEFVGAALRSNTKIEHFAIYNAESLQKEWYDGIFSFVANNPSLETLNVVDASNEMGKWLLEAAAQNTSVEKIMFSLGMCDSFEVVGNKKYVCMRGGTPPDTLTAATWPAHHSIETLRLSWGDGDNRAALTGALLTKEGTKSTLSPIRRLETPWNPVLPDFLSSKVTSIHTVDFYWTDFRCSTHPMRIDALMRGLQGSQTTTELAFLGCKFDGPALDKLLASLQSGKLPIKHLRFKSNRVPRLYGAFVGALLRCECLESLEIGSTSLAIDADFDSIKAGLEICGLARLSLPPTHQVHTLMPALRAASLSSLSFLELDTYYVCAAGISSIVDLIKDARSQLQTLSLHSAFCGNNLVSSILKALGEDAHLHRLMLRDHGIPESADQDISKAKNLKCLEISGLGKSIIRATMGGRVAKSVSKNWGLEEFQILGSRGEEIGWKKPEYPHPVITTTLRKKLAGFMERNKMKKTIFSSSFAEETTQEQCIAMLEAAWALPDSLSLAMWIFKQAPHQFF